MWQCSCGKGCRTALECLSKDKELECLSNVKPKKALTLDKALECLSNVRLNVSLNVRQTL